jgi:hypothetical protein
MPNPQWEEFNRKVIGEFRSNPGKVSGRYAGAPMILVTHTGAKTGKTYITPLVVKARREVTVEVGTEKFKARVTEATGTERDRLYKQQADQMPEFSDHQKKTKRTIPILLLEGV